jgi:hypothetical protein
MRGTNGAIHREVSTEGATNMLWTIIAILLILWVLGLITKFTLGGMLHIILVIAIILLIVQLVSGRRRL